MVERKRKSEREGGGKREEWGRDIGEWKRETIWDRMRDEERKGGVGVEREGGLETKGGKEKERG